MNWIISNEKKVLGVALMCRVAGEVGFIFSLFIFQVYLVHIAVKTSFPVVPSL